MAGGGGGIVYQDRNEPNVMPYTKRAKCRGIILIIINHIATYYKYRKDDCIK